MAYLGTPPRSRVLSSADIGTGAVTLDDISFTDQPTSVNVSGTIDKHTMRLSDQVVIDGDLDITDNLILSKISDDGNAITLTNDSSTRTITGTGSLEASTLTQTPNASLTGMTGIIGNAVTGSPNLNLGNATGSPAINLSNATFPTQRKMGMLERAFDAADGTQQITGIGFQPVFVEFTIVCNDQLSIGFGWDDLTNQNYIVKRPSASGDWKVNGSAGYSLYVVGDGSGNNGQRGSITASDSDSFTITWDKFGSPGSGITMKCIYVAYRY